MERRTVLITGANGGLGQAMTAEFSRNGWKVIATDLPAKITEDDAERGPVRYLAMDVGSDDSVLAARERLRGTLLDLIVNNAALDGYFPLSEAPVAHFKTMFEVNVFGAYRVNQTFLPLLKKPGGRILHISSETVKINIPFMTYPVTKQTLEGYCRTLRQELRFLGVDVTMIRPGAINTLFLDNVKNAKNPVAGSLLAVPFDKFTKQASGEIGKITDPAVVASYIYSVGQKKHTRPVYSVNNDPKLSLSSLIPFSLFERIIHHRLR